LVASAIRIVARGRNFHQPSVSPETRTISSKQIRSSHMFRNRQLSSLIALAVVLTVATLPADAQVKPFKISGAGIAPQGLSMNPADASPHCAVGVATHLGKYYGEGFLKITGPGPNLNPLQASFSSAPEFTFAAANGDLLVCTYGKGGTGLATLTPVGKCFTARFVAEFNPDPTKSTGRFKGVTGSWIMIAQSGPFTFVSPTNTSPFAYSWHGEGTLTFPKK